MRIFFYKFLLFIAIIELCSSKAIHFNKLSLNDKWKMAITSCPVSLSSFIGKQFNVSVPSTVHLNLQKHNQIPNPYFGENLKGLAAISECTVKFYKTITVDEQINNYNKITLVFQGIDTYSTIYLNNQLLGTTENAFLKYEYQVKEHLKIGNNLLVVDIKSPKPFDAKGQSQDRMPFEYAHTRKACYQYSWDWAPYMNTMGIWLPVSLVLFNEAKFSYIWIRNEKLTQHEAILDIVIALDEVAPTQDITQKNITLKILRKDNDQQTISKLSSKYSQKKIKITEPQLWWPHNIGKPHIYEFEFFLMQNDLVLDHKKQVYGLHTVRLNSQGANFQVIVNGYPIYCKGANYVPPDMMYPRLINKDFYPPKSIQSLLDDAVESNFNMLRVWGGGQYESDQFYQMASRKGIMIFQDFMFSDSIYPGTDKFLENVRKQIIYQVRRLRNYPAIVLWSGNNQILQGIQSWGWGQPRYRQNYKKLFEQLIADVLNMESNTLPYIQSSPSKGVGNAGFGLGGDIHYWGVWAAGSPFQSYETAIGGFNSQFGTQSLPVWQTILQFTKEADRHYEADAFFYHQRHSSRFNTLKGYISKYSKPSVNFQLEAYNSGLVQAYGIEIAIRAQRISKPKSYGTLYWQFNDAWPAISWSSIDYFGRWKPLQFFAKNLYKDVILFFHPHTGKFVAINDKLVNIKANYLIQVMLFNGTILFEDSGNLQLKDNEKRPLYVIANGLVQGKQSSAFVYSEIVYGDQEDNKTAVTAFFKPFKDLQLDPAQLEVQYEYGIFEIILSCNYLIKNVYISNTKQYLKFSDNYFDLVPNKLKRVRIINAKTPLSDLKTSMVFRSYRQIFDPSPLSIKFKN